MNESAAVGAQHAAPLQNNKHKPYPAYKPSGIAWFGDIPAHWELKRVKRVFRIVNGATPSSGTPEFWDGDIFWVTPNDLGDLKSDTIVESARKITRLGYINCGTALAPAGSLVLSTRAPIGHLAIAGTELCTNQGCRCLVFREQDNVRYFYYQFIAVRSVLQSLGQGSTFYELSKGNLESTMLVAPPHSEQRAVAAYLDRETARLDALVAKKERLVELLLEKRTALISHAVTRGLDANAPLKDSGVEWPKAIPIRWEIKPLRTVARLQRGHDLTVQERNEGNVPVMTSSGMSGFHDVAKVKGPGVVTGRYGTVGEVYYVDQDYWPMNTTLYVSNFNGNFARYIYYLLKLLPYDAYSGKSAVPGIDRNDLHPIHVVCPPEPEQRAVAAYLDRETAKIDALIAKVRQAIETLQEYRSALISAAVTGKIDARGL